MEFLTTKGIAASIERIIRNAKDFITIISPYVKVDKTYVERLREAEKSNIKIHLIFGKEDMREFEKEKFQCFRSLSIYFLENLHAKCYMNEETALIASMNLYGYSEANNREMGIEVRKNENHKLYDDIKREAKSIKDAAESYNMNVRFYGNPLKFENIAQYTVGYCVRCHDKIDFDTERPFCNACYDVWAQYGNADYPERYCHKCGRQIDSWNEQQVDYAHPLCYSCWKVQSQYAVGYCVRCHDKIDFDTERPFCNACYDVWAQYGNADYPEQYCHKCGRQIDSWNEQQVDYAHPLCYSCWRIQFQ